MPLYKRKPFPLSDPPKNLKPTDEVFQIRFTKEIFKDYSEYLKRLNFYRRKVWSCKATGKGNLTFEEALVSEMKAAEKIQQFPEELMCTVLHDVQFSMLTLKQLVNSISEKMQGNVVVGSEVYCRKNKAVCLCKVVKILEESDGTLYEVDWLDKSKKRTGSALVNGEDMITKLPISRGILKSFIKESTYRSVPWVIHNKLAKKHGISIDPPEELANRISIQDGLVVCKKKRKDADNDEPGGWKRKKLGKENSVALENGKKVEEESDEVKAHAIKYPIDDQLLQPADGDSLSARPPPCSDFKVPMDCVGDLLMVWDFCTSFGRLLHLSPFSLEDFENALCHKDSVPTLIVESYSVLLRLLMNGNTEFSQVIQNKKRKQKITLITWGEYLCDFLEMIKIPEVSDHITTIKRGHYGLLEVHTKLGIFRELVAQALETHLFREKLEECIEERNAFGATRRDEALEEGRKRREEKERKKAMSVGQGATGGHKSEAVEKDSAEQVHQNYVTQNGEISNEIYGVVAPHQKVTTSARNSGDECEDTASKKNNKKQKVDTEGSEDINDSTKRATLKLMKGVIKEALGKKNKEQRIEYLEREIEKRFIRSSPLGKDRNYNRYWFFRRDGRLFVESSDSKQWGYYRTKEELDALMGSLNPKGERERVLRKQMEKFYNKICSELQKRTKEAAHRIAEEEAVLRRSTRVRAPPRDNPAVAFLKYVNKWKED